MNIVGCDPGKRRLVLFKCVVTVAFDTDTPDEVCGLNAQKCKSSRA